MLTPEAKQIVDTTLSASPRRRKSGEERGRDGKSSSAVQCAVVRFQGKESELLYVRPGISGSAVTLAIEQSVDYQYHVWELYTDTPADMRYSAEEVREFIRRTIAHASGNHR